MDKLQQGAADFEKSLAAFDVLNQAQEKTNLPKSVIVIGTGLVVAGLLWAIFGPGLLTNLVAFGFPAYASFNAIESEGTDDDVQWLTYWIVYALFSIPETFGDVFDEYFTLYYPAKFAFTIWLFAPQTRGAEFLYNNFIRKYLLANEKRIDKVVAVVEKVAEEAQEVVQEEVAQVTERAAEEGKEATEEFEKVEAGDAPAEEPKAE